MTQIIAPAGKAVVQLKQRDATAGSNGLIIPDAFRKPATEAVVVSSSVADVAAGDKVLLSGEYAGARFEVDKVEYIAVEAEEILAIL